MTISDSSNDFVTHSFEQLRNDVERLARQLEDMGVIPVCIFHSINFIYFKK